MPPEGPPDQISSKPAVDDNEWDGPWGSIAPVPQSVEILCIEIEQEIGKPRIYYYPYRTIGKWNWSMGAPETLEIHIGGVQLIVSGTGLRRLAEALNLGQLRLVKLTKARVLIGEMFVRSISIEDLKTQN